jgi:small-conductance mechanosensitive channel
MFKEFAQAIDSNSPQTLLTALAVVAGLILTLKIVLRVLVRRLSRIAARTSNNVDDAIVEILRRTGTLFIAAISVYAATRMLELGPLTLRALDRLAILLLSLQVGLWGNAGIRFWVKQWLERREGDAGGGASVSVLGFLARLALWTVILLVGLDNLGVNVTGLVAGLGISGIAVALAVQSILGDLFASLSIVLDKPFEVGDFIIVDQHLGAVEHIGLKSTRIRSLSGEQIVFSNTDLLKSRVRNFKRMLERRVQFSIGATYDTPLSAVEAVPEMIKQVITAQPKARFDRAHFKEFGESAFIFECVYYVLSPDYNLYMDVQQAINLSILKRFLEEKIEFAFPTRTVVLKADGQPGNDVLSEVRKEGR